MEEAPAAEPLWYRVQLERDTIRDLRRRTNLIAMAWSSLTQHAALAEGVPDWRQNTRTVLMNPLSRLLVWNMGFHVEQHMNPTVPFHSLPRLHEAMSRDCPAPYPSTWAAWREMVPGSWRQRHEPTFFVRRPLPGAANVAEAGSAKVAEAGPVATALS